MCIVSLSLIVMILGIIAYSENIKSLGIIENVKKAFGEITQSLNTVAQSNVTTIDVTGITPTLEGEHEHIYKTLYDENKHWEECIFCKEKRNEATHNLTTTWKSGSESCEKNNSYTKTCKCGYSETGHKPCIWDGKYQSSWWRNGYGHTRMCTVCKQEIEHSYYWNGKLYFIDKENTLDPMYPDAEQCISTSGEKLNCNNLGICAICKANWTKGKYHNLKMNLETGKIYCAICYEEFGTVTGSINSNLEIPAKYTHILNIKLTNGAKFNRVNFVRNLGNPFESTNQTITNMNSDNTEFTLTSTAKFNSNWKEKYCYYTDVYTTINGIECRMNSEEEYISPDLQKPTISNIDSGESSTNEWNKIKPITIIGTENYCNTVKIKILDDENTEIYSGETIVNSGKYSISCTPELEAGEEGRIFKAIVTDACDNSVEQEFTISKIDSVAPEITSENKVSEEWSKEKNITFTATDQGIGNVQIAFNDVADYSLATKNGTEYSREYKLVGDVYSPREANVYYKDELGNVSTKKIVLDKLDNTRPTITGASFSNNKLNIMVHDRHEAEGEGSGVEKYRFITSIARLENPEVTTENSTELNVGEDMIIPDIYKVKYVYVVAEDAVGNISNVYEVEVPQLELTSKVNLSGNNGKGVVELDWSSYDSSNKYFVVYRKEKDSADWEKIVGIENRLTGNKYTDNLGNDKESPSLPSINIAGNSERNSINITVDAQDNGSNYMYYVESYDSTTNTLLSRSDS